MIRKHGLLSNCLGFLKREIIQNMQISKNDEVEFVSRHDVNNESENSTKFKTNTEKGVD